MKPHSQKAEDCRLLSQRQILELYPISRVTLYRQIRAGDFPRPVRIGQKNFWREAIVVEHLNSISEKGTI